MQINNPIHMNNWNINKFLNTILAVQLALWGVISLDVMGLQVPILRQFICFIYLTFIPGIIILRILNLHKLSNIETLLYTVGLSITTLMFIGLFMNTVYPFFGISGPISTMPLIITISIVILILCVLCYVVDKNFHDSSFITLNNILSPTALFLCVIPFLSIFGTYLVNVRHCNILIMILIITHTIVVLLITFDKYISKKFYPLAVFLISISLLFHTSLISQYLVGDDVHTEYYFQSLVLTNSLWDNTYPSATNSMLSITMLAPIYSLVLGMDSVWIFKIIYPIFFSLVPLGLFQIFRMQTNDKIAFLSCFFFMSVVTFYTEMLALAKQQIAELFLVLLILVMLDQNIDKMKKSFLFIVFSISLIVSHYGLSYIYMFYLITTWFISVLAVNPVMQNVVNKFHSIYNINNDLHTNQNYSRFKNKPLSSTFVVLIIAFGLTWYMYVSSAIAFNTIVRIGDHIICSIFTDFLNPEAAEGLKLMTTQSAQGLLYEIKRGIYYINQLFIIIGCIELCFKHGEMKFERNYAIISMLNLGICFAGVFVPFFASSLNMTRLYQITIIFLAPFYILGGISIFHWLLRMAPTKPFRASTNSTYLKLVVVIILIPYFLFNTGFISEVSGDAPHSYSLNQDAFLYIITHKEDMFAAEWLSNINSTAIVKNDDHTCHILRHYGFFPDDQIICFTPWNIKTNDSTFIFLNRANIVRDEIWVFSHNDSERIHYPMSLENTTLFQYNNKIYDSSSVIYATK